MNIVIIGATGLTGARILSEALDRGHQVTAIVRNPGTLPAHQHLTAVPCDVTRPAELAGPMAGHDVVISAFNPGKDESGTGTRSIIDAVKASGVGRLLVVGGAGSLEVAPGERVVDQPGFPEQWKARALKTAAFLDELRGETALDWVFVSPAAMLAPGERTGKYRVGGDQLMTDGDGGSRISLEDYAVAMLHGAHRPQHHRARFSVAY